MASSASSSSANSSSRCSRPEQYIKNARIKPNTLESVEYALKFPSGEGQTGPDSYTLLAIDAKFPKEDWERLEHAYETGTVEEIAVAGRAFERGIRSEAKRICDKYIDPPTTMPHAIMFLPTENLYAEVVAVAPASNPKFNPAAGVTIAGPSTFMAILTSFQMGFHTLAIQKKGRRSLARPLQRQKRVRDLRRPHAEGRRPGRHRSKHHPKARRSAPGRSTKPSKTSPASITGAPISNLIGFDDIAGVAPLLAASSDEE